MILHDAGLKNKDYVVALSGFHSVKGEIVLISSFQGDDVMGYFKDDHDQKHVLNNDIIRSLKPEIYSWLNTILPHKVQKMILTPGGHARLTLAQDKAAILLRIYNKIN